MAGEPEARVDLKRAGELENHERKNDVGKHQFGDEERDQIVDELSRFVRLEVRTNVFSGDSRGTREDCAGQEGDVVTRVESCERRVESK